MARPRKAETEKRDERVNLRLTISELVQIEDSAVRAGLPVSDFIRKSALLQRIAAKSDRQLTAETITALMRLGVNLNQITRHFNTGTETPADIDALNELLQRIDGELERLLADGS